MGAMSSLPAIASLAQQGIGMAAQSAREQNAVATRNAQIEQQNQILLQQQERKDRQQRDLLKQQQASARAALSAGGMGFAGGSGAALLSNLTKRTEQGIVDDYAGLVERTTPLTTGGTSAAEQLSKGLQQADQIYGLGKQAFSIFKSV